MSYFQKDIHNQHTNSYIGLMPVLMFFVLMSSKYRVSPSASGHPFRSSNTRLSNPLQACIRFLLSPLPATFQPILRPVFMRIAVQAMYQVYQVHL
jgi:hypothetical protein